MQEKKSPIVGAVLGFFVIGLIYSGGLKKGGLAAVVLIAVGLALNLAIDTTFFSLLADVIGAYLGYTWVKEYNAALDHSSEASV